MRHPSKRTPRPASEADLYDRSWGGHRRGAGRKPKGDRAGVSHKARCAVRRHHPIHVTTKLLGDIRTLRSGQRYRVVRRALAAGCMREGFRLVEFAVMSNHIHLLVEADDRTALSRGMAGLLIRIARALNRAAGRSGKVFADRYHDYVLKTPREVRNALAYVLNNARRHSAQRRQVKPGGWLDPCSSAPEFEGWTGRRSIVRKLDDEPPLPRARTWLLSRGWKLAGAVRVDEVPGGRRGGSGFTSRMA